MMRMSTPQQGNLICRALRLFSPFISPLHSPGAFCPAQQQPGQLCKNCSLGIGQSAVGVLPLLFKRANSCAIQKLCCLSSCELVARGRRACWDIKDAHVLKITADIAQRVIVRIAQCILWRSCQVKLVRTMQCYVWNILTCGGVFPGRSGFQKEL